MAEEINLEKLSELLVLISKNIEASANNQETITNILQNLTRVATYQEERIKILEERNNRDKWWPF